MKRQWLLKTGREGEKGRVRKAVVKDLSWMMSVMLAVGMLTGCAQVPEASQIGKTEALAGTAVNVEEVLGADLTFEFDSEDLETAWEAASAVDITLEDSGVKVDGAGVVIEGGRVQIVQAGTYVLRGTLSEGQIVVSVSKKDKVHLVLNSASITNTQGAPLVIEGKAGHGIVSKDDLRITGGTYEITAVSDGIRGKDSIAVKEDVFSIVAGSDGLQSNNAKDAAKGFIYIEAGVFMIKAGADGIQAETLLRVQDGTFDIESGGGSANGVQHGSAEKRMFGGEPPADGTRPQRGMPSSVMPPGVESPETATAATGSEDTQSAKG